MARSNHVVTSVTNGGWAVVKSGASRASKRFRTKEEAIEFGREISKSERTVLYIHKRDGTVQNRNSYTQETHLEKG